MCILGKERMIKMEAMKELEVLNEHFVLQKFQILIKEAYEKGVADGQQTLGYPMVLRREHLAEILSVSLPTVDRLTSNPSFPRLTEVQARYPRDAVFKWIEENTVIIDQLR